MSARGYIGMDSNFYRDTVGAWVNDTTYFMVVESEEHA